MSVTENISTSNTRALLYARAAGYVVSILLLVLGLTGLIQGAGGFEAFKSVYFIFYGLVLSLPFGRLPDAVWKPLYILLVALSVAFVFIMVAVVMFAYMAAAEMGERLGIPGFEGLLIFLSLLQVPVVLFQRKPDLLD